MNKSRKFINELPVFARKNLANLCGCHEQYLYQLAKYPNVMPSRKLAYALEKYTRGKVKAADFEQEFRAGCKG